MLPLSNAEKDIPSIAARHAVFSVAQSPLETSPIVNPCGEMVNAAFLRRVEVYQEIAVLFIMHNLACFGVVKSGVAHLIFLDVKFVVIKQPRAVLL